MAYLVDSALCFATRMPIISIFSLHSSEFSASGGQVGRIC